MENSLKNEFENLVKEADEASFQTNALQILTERFG